MEKQELRKTISKLPVPKYRIGDVVEFDEPDFELYNLKAVITDIKLIRIDEDHYSILYYTNRDDFSVLFENLIKRKVE